MAAALGVAAFGAWAALTGQMSYQITHGVSMNPGYHQGDLVFTMRTDSYDVGDIAAYHGASPGLVVLHRIIGGDPTGYVFKGDNNASIDPLRPAATELIGRAVLHVPNGGHWLGPLLSPTGLGMIGFMIVSGGAAAVRTRREIPRGRRKKKVKAMSGKGTLGTAATIGKAIVALPPLLRALACVLTTAGLLGIGLAVLGWMGPLAGTPSGSPDDGESVTFSYETRVPRTPAYDDTIVTSPEPIFRRLAHQVDVNVDYRGRPGSMGVAATLSTANGWHTRMQLMGPKTFPGDRFRTTVRLDLDRIDARAKAAATAIGVEPGAVSVSVATTVTSDDATAFAPTLPLVLTPLQLTLAGGASSLVVDESAPAGATLTPRVIEVGGHRLTTAAVARSWAVWLLIGAFLGGVGILLVARRRTPIRDGGEIHRRFPQLLVAVEPMASPPGKPVVNVDDFQALVRLAERYGQLILHWSRNDAETFVVRDEGITYRYRTETSEPAPAELQSVERPTGRAAATAPPVDGPPAPDGPAEGARTPARKRAPRKTPVSLDINQG